MTTNRIPHIHTPSRFTPPPITKRKLCQDHPEWTTDSDKEDMAPDFIAIRHQCPALNQCEDYLQAHEQVGAPIFGVVAGRTYYKGAL